MAKPKFIELAETLTIPILYEDRSVLAIDKPAGWLLAPDDWERTSRNLQLAILSSIQGGEFWAKSRNLKFLRFIHRLDAETTGVLLFCKSQGAIAQYSQLFETRSVEKKYLAVVEGIPKQPDWTVRAKIAPATGTPARMKIDARFGKEAETHFKVLQQSGNRALLEVTPLTGRSHQIRLHLVHSGLPILGDKLYGSKVAPHPDFPLALRATELKYQDPFSKMRIRITAPTASFLAAFRFSLPEKGQVAPDSEKPQPEKVKPRQSPPGKAAPPKN